MAFECNLAAGNKAVCQHHVIRQSVEHQQVLPEITSTLQPMHENPRQNTPGTSSKPEIALKLQMPERLSYAIPGPLTRKGPTPRDLEDMFRAKIGMEMVFCIIQWMSADHKSV